MFYFLFSGGQSDFYIVLHVKKYVEKGHSVTLFCETNVEEKDLYKVSDSFIFLLQMKIA